MDQSQLDGVLELHKERYRLNVWDTHCSHRVTKKTPTKQQLLTRDECSAWLTDDQPAERDKPESDQQDSDQTESDHTVTSHQVSRLVA